MAQLPDLDISGELKRAREDANMEDLERAPDGVPHRSFGMAAMSCVMFAALGVVLLATGGRAGQIAAVLLGILGLPVFMMMMSTRADGARSHVHALR